MSISKLAEQTSLSSKDLQAHTKQLVLSLMQPRPALISLGPVSIVVSAAELTGGTQGPSWLGPSLQTLCSCRDTALTIIVL